MHKIDFTLDAWTKKTGIIFLEYIYLVKNEFKSFKFELFLGTSKISDIWVIRGLLKSMGSITIFKAYHVRQWE